MLTRIEVNWVCSSKFFAVQNVLKLKASDLSLHSPFTHHSRTAPNPLLFSISAMLQLQRLALLMTIAVTTILAINRSAFAQTAPAENDYDADYTSMSADDLYLDELNYRTEPASAVEPLPFLFSMQSRRQRPNEIEIESLTIELNDPGLPIDQQRSGFSVSSPIE